MSLIQLHRSPKVSKKFSFNIWVDYYELKCLINKDHEISLDDMLSEDKQDNVLQDDILKEKIDGDEFNSERAELNDQDFREVFKYIESRQKLLKDFKQVFKYIESRQKFLKDFYPFYIINNTTLSILPLDDNKFLYIYLLLSSNTAYFNSKSTAELFTTQFERLSLYAIRLIYPNFQNELFGTASQKGDYFYGGTILDRLVKLSHCLGTNLKSKAIENARNQSGAGDKGLDIVSFYAFDYEQQKASYVPFCFGQSTCSYDEWKTKQYKIKYSFWNDILNDLPSYHEYMFVPFSLREINGTWSKSELEGMNTIVIDRIRIINLIKQFSTGCTNLLSNQIKDTIKSTLKDKHGG